MDIMDIIHVNIVNIMREARALLAKYTSDHSHDPSLDHQFSEIPFQAAQFATLFQHMQHAVDFRVNA